MDIVIPRLDALAEASWTSVDDYASFKGLLTWLAAVIAWLRPLLGHMHECHAAMLRRGSHGGRVSGRVQNGAAWAAGLLRRTEGAFSIADMQLWPRVASRLRWSRTRILLSEERRGEDEELFVAESGEDAASRGELFNYLQAVWEVHMLTGCVRFCVVGDCAPACSCIAKAHSPTPGMQASGEGGAPSSERGIFRSWFEAHPASKTADWLIKEAVGYLAGGLAYSTSRNYASRVNRLKGFASTFETDGWLICWWEPDPTLLVFFMTYIIGQVSVGTLKVYLYGIRNFCLAHGQADPLRNYHVERCWRGIKRSKKKGNDNRLTLTVDLLKTVVTFAVRRLAEGGMSPREKHDLIVLCIIMVWGVMGLFRIGELVVSGPKRHARVLRRMHCTLFSERDESFLCINLDGSKTDLFRGGLDVWLADLDVVILSTVFWFQRYESSLFSAGLHRGKAQAMFRWANGEMVTREKFVAGARQLLAQSGVDDGSRFNGISLRRAPSVGRPWLGKRISNFSSGVMSPRWASWAVTRNETCGKLESGTSLWTCRKACLRVAEKIKKQLYETFLLQTEQNDVGDSLYKKGLKIYDGFLTQQCSKNPADMMSRHLYPSGWAFSPFPEHLLSSCV
eukprot:g9376.t1